jgi:hypothetical protein
MSNGLFKLPKDPFFALEESTALVTRLQDERDELRRQLTKAEAQRDEAVSAVRRLSEGQPFNEVVIADTVNRRTARLEEQLTDMTGQRDRSIDLSSVLENELIEQDGLIDMLRLAILAQRELDLPIGERIRLLEEALTASAPNRVEE